MVHLVTLEEEAQKKLKEFLQNVEDRNFVWMDEVLEEAIKMFSSDSSGEPLLMPKTPSQKNRQKKSAYLLLRKISFPKRGCQKDTVPGHRLLNRLPKTSSTEKIQI